MQIINFEEVFDLDATVVLISESLKSGGVVCLPSDAGYLLVVSSNSVEKIEQIRKLLNYSSPAVLLFNDKSKLNSIIDNKDVVLRQLIEEYFPGKLIIEADGSGIYESNLVRFRMIDSNLISLILNKVNFNIISFELVTSTGEVLYASEQIVDLFDNHDCLDLILDDGVLDLHRLPDILKVADNQIAFIREGELVSTLISQFSLKH
jgi:tRNA A37 threonylcarbamoyladenosine synthetase subunit TsaC/SUA5/YrdC